MATLYPNAQLSFGELAKRLGPGKDIVDIAEVLEARAPILRDAIWYESNQPASELVVRRASLPSGTWRKANKGVKKEASATQTVTEGIARLEARSEVDEALLELVSNKKAARRSEDLAFVQGLAQEFAKTLVWGTTEGATVSAPEEILGLQQRLRTVGTPATVIDNGGSTASTVTSIYVVNWSRNGAYCVYPSGAKRGDLGLFVRDVGKEKVDDGTDPYYAWVTQFVWWVGLAVRDELAIGRVGNIDITSGTGKYIFNEDKLIECLNLGHFPQATTSIYYNQTIATQAQIRLKDKTNVNWAPAKGLAGEPIMTFGGYRCRMMENNIILNTEEVIS